MLSNESVIISYNLLFKLWICYNMIWICYFKMLICFFKLGICYNKLWTCYFKMWICYIKIWICYFKLWSCYFKLTNLKKQNWNQICLAVLLLRTSALGKPNHSQPDSRGAVVSYWRKYVHEVLVYRFGGQSLPRKSVIRLTDRPDMTLDVYRGRKTTTQQQQLSHAVLTKYV